MSLSGVPSSKRNHIVPQNAPTSRSLRHALSPSYSFLMITFSGGKCDWTGNRCMTLMETRWVSWQRYKLQPPVRPPKRVVFVLTRANSGVMTFLMNREGGPVWCTSDWGGGGVGGIAIMHKLTDGILPCPQSGGNHVLTCSMRLIWKLASQHAFFSSVSECIVRSGVLIPSR